MYRLGSPHLQSIEHWQYTLMTCLINTINVSVHVESLLYTELPQCHSSDFFMFKTHMYFNLLWNSNVVNYPNLRECDLLKRLIKLTFPFSKHRSTWILVLVSSTWTYEVVELRAEDLDRERFQLEHLTQTPEILLKYITSIFWKEMWVEAEPLPNS